MSLAHIPERDFGFAHQTELAREMLFAVPRPYTQCAKRRTDQIFTRRSRNELPITLTEESAIAVAAIIGDSSKPKTG